MVVVAGAGQGHLVGTLIILGRVLGVWGLIPDLHLDLSFCLLDVGQLGLGGGLLLQQLLTEVYNMKDVIYDPVAGSLQGHGFQSGCHHLTKVQGYLVFYTV